MNPRWGVVVAAALGCAYLASAALAAPGEPLRIVVPGGPIAPGERVQLKAVPVGNPLEPERWSRLSGLGLMGSSGLFRAPYVVPEGGATTTVHVSRGPRGSEIVAEATLRLAGGSVPGADSCVGIGQASIPGLGAYTGVVVDTLPEAITIVRAVYPVSARARKIEGSLVVNVLVCRSGSVLDAYPLWPQGAAPEPTLEQAALDAARQWVFKPAMAAGNPVAVWVTIPFSFKL